MNILFSINGGMGKSVMATGICEAIKKKYPASNLIVITGYPEVFSGISCVDFSFDLNHESYFYSKYIDGQDFMMMGQEPYMETDHLQNKQHVIETWCKMNDIPYNGEMPKVVINEREKTFFTVKYPCDRPIMVIQSNGGAAQQELRYSWARDIPRSFVQSVIEHYKDKYQIYHIRRENQIGYDHTIPFTDSYKGIASIILRSEKRLLMDSVGQHIAAALNKPSSVLWIANKPHIFGYQIHHNLIANRETIKPDLRYSAFTKYNIVGALHEFPYNSEVEMFNIDDIITSIEQQ
jgi:hypothetical protein